MKLIRFLTNYTIFVFMVAIALSLIPIVILLPVLNWNMWHEFSDKWLWEGESGGIRGFVKYLEEER